MTLTKKKLYPLAASANLFASGLILYALFGDPSLAFFAALKFAVFVASLLSAYSCFIVSPWLSFLSLSLLTTGYIHTVAEQRKSDWVLWNWIAIGLFVTATLILIFSLVKWTKGKALWALAICGLLFFGGLFGWARYDLWLYQQGLSPTAQEWAYYIGRVHVGKGRVYKYDRILTEEERRDIDRYEAAFKVQRRPKGIVTPEGTFYEWTKPGMPTQAEVNEVINAHIENTAK